MALSWGHLIKWYSFVVICGYAWDAHFPRYLKRDALRVVAGLSVRNVNSQNLTAQPANLKKEKKN